MARKRRRTPKNLNMIRLGLSICALALVLIIGTEGVGILEQRMAVKIENAGKQMTAHVTEDGAAQVFMNGRWYRMRDMETMLVTGIDNFGSVTSSSSYNNTNQADFMMLIVRDAQTGRASAIHLNRDTMTDITMLGVTGEKVGTQKAQLALAFNYGRGQQDSSLNTADAVSRLLYGMEIDHYITVTMDAVPIMNDWVGGVTLEVMGDMTSADSALVEGREIKLKGEQALAYIRTRMGLDDSTNINRMERQRQYASAWVAAAKDKLSDSAAVSRLVMDMSDYHYSDCTVDELVEFANAMSENESMQIHELPGEAVRGEEFMEFYADDEEIQQLVLELFYDAV